MDSNAKNIFLGVIASLIASGFILLFSSEWYYFIIVFLILFASYLCRFVLKVNRYGGIRDVVNRRNRFTSLFKKLMEASINVDLLLVNGSRLIAYPDSPLQQSLSKRSGRYDYRKKIRILLLDPEAEKYVKERMRNIEAAEAHQEHISQLIKVVSRIAEENDINVEIRLYSIMPIFNMLLFDSELFLTVYTNEDRACITPTFRVKKDSVLKKGFSYYFEGIWDNAKVEYKKTVK